MVTVLWIGVKAVTVTVEMDDNASMWNNCISTTIAGPTENLKFLTIILEWKWIIIVNVYLILEG